MHRGTEILIARRAAGVLQRPVEGRLKLPTGTIGAIERGKLTVSDEDYERIHEAIREISQSTKGESECEATLAST